MGDSKENRRKKVTTKTKNLRNLKEGQKIRAIDPCTMHPDGRQALIVGKEYAIRGAGWNAFSIVSEVSNNHYFSVFDFDKYFELVEETPQIPELTENQLTMKNLKVKQKIKAIDPCVLEHNGKESLIVGKEYPIKYIGEEYLTIDSEIQREHRFSLKKIHSYFHIEEAPQIPELTGVEMEVSQNKESWYKNLVLGRYNDGYITSDGGFWNFARPIQPKTVELTLEEIAEKLGVDKVIIKN